jgi:hypothetical protein
MQSVLKDKQPHKEETQKVQSILGNNDVDIANNSIF